MIETPEYFNSQVCQFRQMMGNLQYWNGGEPKPCLDKCFQVLFTLSYNVKSTPENLERVQTTFEALAMEYSHRRSMMYSLKLKKELGLVH